MYPDEFHPGDLEKGKDFCSKAIGYTQVLHDISPLLPYDMIQSMDPHRDTPT